MCRLCFFFQAEDGIRDRSPSRGLGDVYKRQVLGTLDECRFTYNGVHVSKEVARQFYKNTIWYNDLEQAKKDAEAKGVQDWKSLCKSQPPILDPKLKTIISQMYMAAANEMTNIKLFDTPNLAKVINAYRDFMSEKA